MTINYASPMGFFYIYHEKTSTLSVSDTVPEGPTTTDFNIFRKHFKDRFRIKFRGQRVTGGAVPSTYSPRWSALAFLAGTKYDIKCGKYNRLTIPLHGNWYSFQNDKVISSIEKEFVDEAKGTMEIMGQRLDLKMLNFISGHYGKNDLPVVKQLNMNTVYSIGVNRWNGCETKVQDQIVMEYKYDLMDRLQILKILKDLSGDCIENIYKYIHQLSPCLTFCYGPIKKW